MNSYKLKNVSSIELNNLINEKLKKLRETNKILNFIQIGAHDGVSYDDMANLVLNKEDVGIFIEPIKIIFERLKINKFDFKKSNFSNVAIIPDETFESKIFYQDKVGGGGQSTFVSTIYNENIHTIEYVNSITVDEFMKNNVNFNIDIVFLDCEGYDHDIIVNLIKYQTPNIIYFESWNVENLNIAFKYKKFTTRDEILDLLSINGYEFVFESTQENILAYKI